MLFITLNQIRLSLDKCATRKYQVRVLSNKTTTERLQRTNTNYDLLVPLSKSWDNWVRNICLSYKRNRKALHSKSIFWDTPRISRTSLLFSIFRFSSFACIQSLSYNNSYVVCLPKHLTENYFHSSQWVSWPIYPLG